MMRSTILPVLGLVLLLARSAVCEQGNCPEKRPQTIEGSETNNPSDTLTKYRCSDQGTGLKWGSAGTVSCRNWVVTPAHFKPGDCTKVAFTCCAPDQSLNKTHFWYTSTASEGATCTEPDAESGCALLNSEALPFPAGAVYDCVGTGSNAHCETQFRITPTLSELLADREL